uniref:Uncharacterized protein n=1 Tax=Arundo donax TaxID=35708 RepID=A0A0A9CIN6_ARUDO
MRLQDGWDQSLGHMEFIKETCEEISTGAMSEVADSAAGQMASSLAVWVDEHMPSVRVSPGPEGLTVGTCSGYRFGRAWQSAVAWCCSV